MSFNDCFSKTFVSNIHLIVLAKAIGWVVPHGKVYLLVAARLRAGAQPSEPWLAPSPPNNNAFMFLKSRRDRELIHFSHIFLNIKLTACLYVGPRLSCYMLCAVSGLVRLQNTHF